MKCPICGFEQYEDIGWNYCHYCGTVLFFINPKDYIENKFGKYPNYIVLNKKEYKITKQYYDFKPVSLASSGYFIVDEKINENDQEKYYEIYVWSIEGGYYAIVLVPI